MLSSHSVKTITGYIYIYILPCIVLTEWELNMHYIYRERVVGTPCRRPLFSIYYYIFLYCSWYIRGYKLRPVSTGNIHTEELDKHGNDGNYLVASFPWRPTGRQIKTSPSTLDKYIVEGNSHADIARSSDQSNDPCLGLLTMYTVRFGTSQWLDKCTKSPESIYRQMRGTILPASLDWTGLDWSELCGAFIEHWMWQWSR